MAVLAYNILVIISNAYNITFLVLNNEYKMLLLEIFIL